MGIGSVVDGSVQVCAGVEVGSSFSDTLVSVDDSEDEEGTMH